MGKEVQVFVLENDNIHDNCVYRINQEYLREHKYKVRVEISREVPTRTNPQNARYWAMVGGYVERQQAAIQAGADKTGYEDFDFRKAMLESQTLPMTTQLFIFCETSEEFHTRIKKLFGVKTSTKLSIAEFAKRFGDQVEALLEMVVTDIEHFVETQL